LAKGETFNEFRHMIREKGAQSPKFSWSEKSHSRVDIDHVFPVTGIGTVALGRVRAGQLKKGEQLHVFPSKRVCTVRSIQINDVDFKEADTGTRVGVALRGLLPKDVERGYILSNSVSWIISSEVEVQIKVMPYSKLPEVGKTRHLIAGLQAIPAKVLSCAPIKDSEPDLYSLTLQLERDIAYYHEEPILLVDLNGKPKTIGLCKFN
ncbi:MAG: EF-Tu/IF-2/RF-3 family GTPase, partial [Candidatus Heimdallarchaeaceae archaeon]